MRIPEELLSRMDTVGAIFLERNGEERQAFKAAEELSECITEIMKLFATRNGSKEALAGEIADVYITLNTLVSMLGDDFVLGFLDQKLVKAENKILEFKD